MTLHREGRVTIILTLVLLDAVAITTWLLSENLWLTIGLSVPFFVVFLLVLWFFRIPNRQTTTDENVIIAPADGKVVVIERVKENEYFNDERIMVSIFMSPLNVHAQYYPIAGKVSYVKYHPGKYLVAWHPKSSELNERSTMVVTSHKGEVLFRQIAGAMARRIVCYAKQGIQVEQHQEAGFIKFGSRVDVFLPLNAEVKVQLGQKVYGRGTKLAAW
jgi:phosphatidylserine decarboxylase